MNAVQFMCDKNFSSQSMVLRSTIHAEGNYASSRQDFINKFQIALKECYETEYWLELFVETNIITQNEYNSLINSCNKIRKLLVASINTAKAGQ